LANGSGNHTQLIKCAGFGGQGILALGEIIAIAAMNEGRNVSWLPSYGPESRGGTCNCDVILSDISIAAPIVNHPEVALLFNQPSVDKFEPTVPGGGTVFYDAGLAEPASLRSDIQYVGISFTSIAMELGSDRVANMVALGAFVGRLESVLHQHAVEAMHQKFAGKDKLFPVNEKAIEEGIKRGRPDKP
jgi:2-oxoglutarate ferredoxin oxidoreductase subunit gamma